MLSMFYKISLKYNYCFQSHVPHDIFTLSDSIMGPWSLTEMTFDVEKQLFFLIFLCIIFIAWVGYVTYSTKRCTRLPLFVLRIYFYSIYSISSTIHCFTLPKMSIKVKKSKVPRTEINNSYWSNWKTPANHKIPDRVHFYSERKHMEMCIWENHTLVINTYNY